ncbi:hypothetical protein NBG4_1070003 [Candidatus Sulfobium mesophilum]|uniref:Uncharacterized protein n=1 Tax=Candidatus Sulfobium mesophilum TaxID=2016548 RepID=A0A2U3QEC8_9BACT|nr:hypothetical protein NBG4_1070003 [Candidatus Sulfobium mesophilum]
MEVLKSKQNFIRAKTLRAKHIVIDGKSVIQTAGTVVAIPLVNWQEIVEAAGGIGNLEFEGIPDEAAYEVQATERYRAAAHPIELRLYEAGSIVSFTREQAIEYMLSAGRVTPVDKSVPDLSLFCRLRYRLDRSTPGGKSPEQQRKEKALHEGFEAYQQSLKERLSWIKGR